MNRLPATFEVPVEPDPAAPRPAASQGRFDVVVIGASAGGLTAAYTVLRNLPADFSLPVVLMLHLATNAELPGLYARLNYDIDWLQAGVPLQPRMLYVCPPRSFVEMLPDGTCQISPCEGAIDRPIDRLFDSVARSFGHRALCVVMSGMGRDGAAGALEIHSIGGCVLVQSTASAEHPDMPNAAIEAGAADMVLPLQDMAQVITEIHAGTPRPKVRSEIAAIHRVFGDQSKVAAAALEVDWGRTPIGPVSGWPEELRVVTRMAMESPSPSAIFWGSELSLLYNDAWKELLEESTERLALGMPMRRSDSRLWRLVAPMLERVISRGHVVGGEDHPLLIQRPEANAEVYLTLSYSAIRDASGAVSGVHATAWDTTRNVVAERRMRLLHTLAAMVAGATTPRGACELAAQAAATDGEDIPFALFYLLDEGHRQATLAGAAGVLPGSAIAPNVLSTAQDEPTEWPLAWMFAKPAGDEGARMLLDDFPSRFPSLVPLSGASPGTQPPRQAFLMPLRSTRDRGALGVVIVALSPHRQFDDSYRSFIDLLARQVNAGIAEARAKQLERERLERFAELDRVKTEFFSNVSHEFRTPLTLMLAPLEDLLRRQDALPAKIRSELDSVARNARRLQRLVNALLDFSEIESRRQRTMLEPVDLASLTGDIASAFRSAIEGAGLVLRLDLAQDMAPVPLNREMWQKVISNLLSNAFKFTFAGEITVRLRALRLHAELEIADTGVGIPRNELGNIFKRFHRIRGTRARSAEGSGIGLAIVQDLVGRMGGQITVRSTVGIGTTFRIWLPFKARTQPQAAPDLRQTDVPASSPTVSPLVTELASEASRWLLNARSHTLHQDIVEDIVEPGEPKATEEGKGCLLVIDDNPDIREYLHRLLSPHWQVELAATADEALAAAQASPPDAVLADIMMPGIDGLELLRHLRDDARLKQVPVILLSARADEASAIEGLQAGADDYIAKPFSPRELVARVESVVKRARVDAALREREAFLSALSDALEMALDEMPLETSLGLLGQAAAQQFGARTRTAFYLANAEGTSLHHVVGMGREYAKVIDGFRIGPQSLACGLAAHTGEPVLTTDVMVEPRWEPWRAVASRFDYRGCWSFPIRTSTGRHVGSFAVYWRAPRAATPTDVDFAIHVTRVAAIIISRHFLSQRSTEIAAPQSRARKA